MGHTIGRTLVGELLHRLDYRLQANRKTREGSHNPDRDAQFHYINDRVKEALAAGEAGDLGRYQEEGACRRFQERRTRMATEGFAPRKFACTISSFPKLGAPHPMVSTISPTTSDGSVWASTTTLRLSRQRHSKLVEAHGRERYPSARSLLITCRWRRPATVRCVRLWKIELQKLADETRRSHHRVSTCRPAPAMEQIEHRLFSFITGNWRGKPLVSHQVIVSDRSYDDQDRSQGSLRTRSNTYPGRHQGVRRRHRSRQPHTHDFHGDGTILSAPTPSPEAIAPGRV